MKPPWAAKGSDVKAGMQAALALVLASGAAAHAQIPFIFSDLTIDLSRSGDCKALGDLDLDGKADAIIGGSALTWYESGAAFAPHTIRAQPIHKEFTTDAQAADVDGDGDIDIIIGDGAGAGNLLWFENPRINGPSGPVGDPRIGADWIVHTIGTQGNTVHDIEVADLDHDGSLDVVSSGHGFTRVWKRSGATWLSKDLSSLAGAGVFIGDIDRDGKPDIATPTGWLKNPGDIINGTWTRFPIAQTDSGDECLLADLNQDGRLDLIVCNAHTRGPLYCFEQPATATSPAWNRIPIDYFVGSHHPETADFNNDGRPDLLLGLELGEIIVYLNLGGTPTLYDKQILRLTGGHNARRGDINGDGLPDILSCDYIGIPPVTILRNRWCPANCDLSAGTPLLTVNDFTCFLNAFAGGSTYANCDNSTRAPTLNAMDFQCFIQQFARGCP